MFTFPSDDELDGRRVLVVGLGAFGGGEAVVRFLVERGATVTVTDRRPAADLEMTLERLSGVPFATRLGGHDEADVDAADLMVVNPAVPPASSMVTAARRAGVPLTSEVGLTLSRIRGRLCLVTGSKGKSTTAALIHAMAVADGKDAWLGGNIGRSLLPDVGRIGDDSVVVFEVSSFQLEQLAGLPRRVAVTVLTNLFPVHLDRHGDFESYCDVKATAMDGASAAVVPLDDDVATRLARQCGVAVRGHAPSYSPDAELYLEGDSIRDRTRVRVERGTVRLPGRHNLRNVMAALLAGDALGLAEEACVRGASRFAGLPHRLQTILVRGGVRVVDDSIATTPTSVAAAVCAIGQGVVLLLGGKDTGARLDEVIALAPAVDRVVAFGEAGGRVASEVGRAGMRVERVEGLDDAARSAVSAARPGQVILLSPGFPSYDEFRNFRERGERLREVVEALFAAAPERGGSCDDPSACIE